MYIFQWTGNSGKTYLLKNISYATLTDVFKLCSICPISAVDPQDYSIHNSLHTLLHFANESPVAKVVVAENVSREDVAKLKLIFRDSHRFFHAPLVSLLFPLDEAFSTYTITIESRTMVVYIGKRTGTMFTTIAPDFQFDPYWYDISGLPYMMIGEGGYSASYEYYVQSSGSVRCLTDCVPWFNRTRQAYERVPIRTQYPFLYVSSGLVDSLSQTVFESDTGSGSLAKGLSKDLITTFATTNMLRPICAYAPVMKNIENDPINQIDIRGYTCGNLYVPGPFTRSTRIQDYGLYATSRAPVTLSSDFMANQTEQGVVNRDTIVPIYHNGISYGHNTCYDHRQRRIFRMKREEVRDIIRQVSRLRLYRIDDGSDVNSGSFKVVRL